MNSSQADTLVSGCVLGVLVMGMADDYVVKEENPSFKFYIAVAVTGATLAYIADVNPEVAAWLSVIIFLVVLMEEGAPVLKALQGDENIGKVTPAGSGKGGINDFPVIPFTKEKGKKKPTVFKGPQLLPVKVKKPAPAREPVRAKVKFRFFPSPIFTPTPVPGTNEGTVSLPSGGGLRIPNLAEWEKGTAVAAGSVGAVAVIKGVVEFLGAAADEVVRPVG